MRKFVCYLFLAVLLSVYSCGNKPQYIIPEVKEISFADQERGFVEPVKMDYCPMGVFDIMSYDKYLFFITQNKNAYLRVYDVEKGAEVAALCQQGRANNEFNFPIFFNSEQAYTVNGEIMLPIKDNQSSLKEINITQSIDNQRTVINRTASCIQNTSSHLAFVDDDFSRTFVSDLKLSSAEPRVSVISSDSKFVSDLKLSSAEPAQPVKFYIQGADEQKTDVPAFKDVMNGSDQFAICNYYSGVLIKHPSRNIMTYSMAYLNYVLFFDLDTGKTFAIHQKGSETLDKEVTENPNLLHFGDATASDDYYFTFYFANCRKNPEADYVCEVLAFDWDGNYVGGFKTNTAIHRIAYNEKTKSLYCVNIGEELMYAIPVKEFIK